MKKSFVFFLLSAFLAIIYVQGCGKKQPESLIVLRGATIIDCTGAPAQANMTVVIKGNHIYTLGKTDKVEVAKNIQVVDATDKYLIPGLWDMHVHTGEKDTFFPLYIANGITGIRDMGGDLVRATGNASLSLDSLNKWKEEIKRGTLVGPRIVATGPIIDGPKPFWPGVTTPVGSEAEARDLVKALKYRGADFIKVYETLPREIYYAIADESKKNQLPFAGHVPKSITAAEASNAGQISIEHLDGIYNSNSGNSLSDLYTLFRSNGTWQIPTLAAYRDLVRNDDSFRNDYRLKYIPEYIKEIWSRSSWWHTSRTEKDIAKGKEEFRIRLKIVKEMHESGINILAGSDAANPYTYPGFSLHDELKYMVEAGLTSQEAIQTATLNPAKFLGMQDSLGTIEEGKIANLVLLDADPLQDITNTQKINAVILSGKYLPKKMLQKMLADVEAAAMYK